MNIMAMLFAAVFLLAICNATVNLAIASPQQTEFVTVAAPVANELGATDEVGFDCNEICHKPCEACVRQCGGGGACEHQCDCDFFNDIDNICRKTGCVGYVETCLAKMKSRSESVEALTDGPVESADDHSLLEGLPPKPCVICRTRIDICKKKCESLDSACKDAYDCYWKRQNFNCKECDIPRLATRRRRASVIKNMLHQRALPIESLDDPAAPPSSSEEPESPIAESPEDHPDMDIGVPSNPINECKLAVIGCKSRCLHKGACDSYCNCRYKNSYMCRGTKLACDK